MSWLVTGGAGYIGSHVVRALRSAGIDTVAFDDLSSGFRAFVPDDVPFVEGTILDGELVARTLREHEVTGVVHVAGFKYAGVSVERPLHTYEQNVTGMATLLRAMAETGVTKAVFSSSAAVYGTPDVETVVESTPKNPESPYGESKLIGEWLLRDMEVAAGFATTSLRYFNVVGSGSPTCTTPARTTCSRWSSTRCSPAGPRGSTATTTPPRTAPVSATTCTWPTWRTRTPWPHGSSRPGSRSSAPTTSAAATA